MPNNSFDPFAAVAVGAGGNPQNVAYGTDELSRFVRARQGSNASFQAANVGAGAAATQPNYSSTEINQYLRDNNLLNSSGQITDPHAVYKAAAQYGVTGAQLDSALGLQAGTADNWSKAAGYQPLGSTAQLAAGAGYQPHGSTTNYANAAGYQPQGSTTNYANASGSYQGIPGYGANAGYAPGGYQGMQALAVRPSTNYWQQVMARGSVNNKLFE